MWLLMERYSLTHSYRNCRVLCLFDSFGLNSHVESRSSHSKTILYSESCLVSGLAQTTRNRTLATLKLRVSEMRTSSQPAIDK